MRTNLRRLKHPKDRNSSDPQAPQKSWAERHAPLATIVGAYSTLLAVVIAALGYYFTVIPLYQKAALDELIAKREVELKEAQAAILAAKREAYARQRENFARAIEFAAVDCSDIRASFRQPDPNFDDKDSRQADHQRNVRLNVEVVSCLASVLAKYEARKRLTETDARHVGLLLATLGEKLDRQRLEAIARIENLPNLAVADPSVLDPVGPIVQRADADVARWRKYLPEVDLEKERRERFEYRVRITQARIARDYRRDSSQAIREAIRGLQWPKDEAS